VLAGLLQLHGQLELPREREAASYGSGASLANAAHQAEVVLGGVDQGLQGAELFYQAAPDRAGEAGHLGELAESARVQGEGTAGVRVTQGRCRFGGVRQVRDAEPFQAASGLLVGGILREVTRTSASCCLGIQCVACSSWSLTRAPSVPSSVT